MSTPRSSTASRAACATTSRKANTSRTTSRIIAGTLPCKRAGFLVALRGTLGEDENLFEFGEVHGRGHFSELIQAQVPLLHAGDRTRPSDWEGSVGPGPTCRRSSHAHLIGAQQVLDTSFVVVHPSRPCLAARRLNPCGEPPRPRPTLRPPSASRLHQHDRPRAETWPTRPSVLTTACQRPRGRPVRGPGARGSLGTAATRPWR